MQITSIAAKVTVPVTAQREKGPLEMRKVLGTNAGTNSRQALSSTTI